ILVAASPEVNSTQNHLQLNVYHDIGVTRNKIVTAQFECYQKIMKDNDHNKIGPVCNRTWDGWLCWDDTEAGFTSEQHCPDYFQDFDPSEMVTKICRENGHWFLHPDSNRTWTNYTRCNEHTNEGIMTAMNLFYLALIGHGLSLIALFISLGIFFNFKSLSCQRITLHKNLFFSFVLNSVITIIWLTAVANNQELVQRNPVRLWMDGWMGIYLHTLIVVAVFAEKQHLMWYYLLGWGRYWGMWYYLPGWGFPLIPASIHAIARSYYYNDNCWISSNTSLLYIIHGPICAALLGLLVATIFCFFNGEVQGVLRRHWNQYRIQFGSTFTHSDAMRSASYTASSISEVQGCYSIDSNTEHLNGKGGCLDIETSVLKSENPFA
ncbi:unnamed protein product, partial [Coregonus sp. 'balchen']